MKNNEERKRKWKLYHEAKEWIIPSPSWFDKPLIYSIDDFVEHFKISKEEAKKLIKKLVEDNKLLKTDGVYKAIRLCTMCGKLFDDWDLQENNHIKHGFGYGSIHDLQIFEADLCCDCYDKVIDIILPLFPTSPLRNADIYGKTPEGFAYIEDTYEHDNDPY